MFPTRIHNGLAWETLKWAALIALALALVALMTHAVPAAEPGSLPESIDQWSSPMGRDDAPIGTGMIDFSTMPAEMWYERIWAILEHHRAGRLEEAAAGWQAVPLDEAHAVWREAARGQAYLHLGNFAEAEARLNAARNLDPENPLVHYLLGLLRLHQAETAYEWPDAVGPVQWVAHLEAAPAGNGGRYIAPFTKSLYELMVIHHLRTAIEYAPLLHEEEPMVAGDPWSTLSLEPKVGDLLMALHADNLAARAGETLGFLYLEHDRLNEAEEAFGQAALAGANERAGYEALGEAYEAAGRPADAVRAYAKALTQGGPVVGPTQDLLRNLRDSFDDLS